VGGFLFQALGADVVSTLRSAASGQSVWLMKA